MTRIRTIPFLVGLGLALVTANASGQAVNEYRALRDAVREARMQVIELRGRVVAVIAEGRFKLDLTSADLARVGMPEDYPVAVAARGRQTTARFLTTDEARARDEYARQVGAQAPDVDEIRLIADGIGKKGAAAQIELNAWSAGELLYLGLSVGDPVTISARIPARKGK